MRRWVVCLLLAAPLLACRSTRRSADERPLLPIVERGEDSVRHELAARLQAFAGERSLLRIRATSGERTQSFRAQLQIDAGRRVLLTAYTPLGTTALRLFAEGDSVTFVNDLESTWWQGSTAEMARSFPFFGSADVPTMALILAGLAPDHPSATYDVGAGGLRSAKVGGATVLFDPPAYPPARVSVNASSAQLQIEHLESMSSDEVLRAPEIPKSYRCCVPPAL